MRSPERDLEGDLHAGVVHLLDVSQVQLAPYSQRAVGGDGAVTLGPQVLLRRFFLQSLSSSKGKVLLTW